MTSDEALIAIGREVVAELALYDWLHDRDELSEAGEQWRDTLHRMIAEAGVHDAVS